MVALTVISAAWLLLGGSDLVQTMSVDGRVLSILVVVVALGAVATTAVASRSAAIRSRIAPFAGRMLSSPAEHPILALARCCADRWVLGHPDWHHGRAAAALRRSGFAFASFRHHGRAGAGRHAQSGARRRGRERSVDGGGGAAGGNSRRASRAGGGCLPAGALSGDAARLGSGAAGAGGRPSSLMSAIPDTFRRSTREP